MKPRFLYPQHPKSGVLIAHMQLDEYERQNLWLAQLKFQGSNCVLWVYNDQFMIWNRQGVPFTNFEIKESMRDCVKQLDLEVDTEYVFNGELLHSKAKDKRTDRQVVTNTIVLFDILFVKKYLNTEPLEQRLDLLRKICKNPKTLDKDNQGLIVAQANESQIWLAEVFENEFSYHFWRFVEEDNGFDRYPLIEGLMLKQKNSFNVGFGNKPVDVTWMLRCRKKKSKVYTL